MKADVGPTQPDLGLAEQVVSDGSRVLLVAYEFPPNPSPQSLRWAYLARELALAGHEVHVLAPEHPGTGDGLPQLPTSVRVHRTYAGPIMGLLNARAKRRPVLQPRCSSDAIAPARSLAEETRSDELNWKGRLWHTSLNWKGRVFLLVQTILAKILFPDLRAEWMPWARRRLHELLDQLQPDVVISSHEPATTLSLGLLAKQQGFRWIADLGDPVLAPYTPKRWRERALRLERAVCQQADAITVTSEIARNLLVARHGVVPELITVLTQGFDGRAATTTAHRRGTSPSGRLELLYTGSFYGFRRALDLVEAVAAEPRVRLSIAAIKVPAEIVEASLRVPEAIRLLGFLPHASALQLQRQADILVNIGNDDPCQVPGKLYEYLGAARPILHLDDDGTSASAELIRRYRRGWTCSNRRAAICIQLKALISAWRQGAMEAGLDLEPDIVGRHDWRALGAHLQKLVRPVTEVDE